jgi:hypothetical protein
VSYPYRCCRRIVTVGGASRRNLPGAPVSALHRGGGEPAHQGVHQAADAVLRSYASGAVSCSASIFFFCFVINVILVLSSMFFFSGRAGHSSEAVTKSAETSPPMFFCGGREYVAHFS